jgi:PPK2 family polyphosphate:nucleotide phosphotransferase
MDYRKKFVVEPGAKVKLRKVDPEYNGKHLSEVVAQPETEKHCKQLTELQDLLYASKTHALLIVLQAMDAGGKDGAVSHVMSAMNPQGTFVTSFKEPTAIELQHDFLWRVHAHAPAKGTVAIFNRSHYESVLVERVHKLVPRQMWSERYELINDFESLLYTQNNTHVIKFFLHISPEEQLERFKQRLDDPTRNWKISESDYTEREYWSNYMEAYQDAFARTSTKHAPWYVIPSNHKWFRNLAISQIVAATMNDMGMQLPKPTVDLEMIRQQYHQAAKEEGGKDPDQPKHKKRVKAKASK